MATQTRRQWIHPRHGSSPQACCPLQWPDSVAVNPLIAGAIGFVYILLVLGLPRLDPTNLSWLDRDPATFYIGWELFRQDPRLHWRLTFTDRLSYPLGDSLPFQSPQWSSLGQEHANLLVVPPWQCLHAAGRTDTPGGLDGFRIFGMLAVSQGMRTNSYYAARYSAASLAFHCDQAVEDLQRNPLSPDSAYVVSPAIARIIAEGPTGPSACHTLDGFILCSAKTDFGLGPSSFAAVPIMYASGRIESWRDAMEKGYFLGDWHAAEPDGIWSQGYGVVQFRLTPEQRSRYHAVSLHLGVPVGAKGVQYRIQSGSHEQSGAFLGSPVPKVEVFEVRVPLQGSADDVEKIVLSTQDAVRPVDIGLNHDSRRLGLGVQNIRLLP